MINYAEIPVNYNYLDHILDTLLVDINDSKTLVKNPKKFLKDAKQLTYVEVRAAVPHDAYKKLVKNTMSARINRFMAAYAPNDKIHEHHWNAIFSREQRAIKQVDRIRAINASFKSVDELFR